MKLLAIAVTMLASSAALAATDDLVGLWQASRDFGPELRGSLSLEEREGAPQACIAGRTAPVELRAGTRSFAFEGGKGSFRGRPSDTGDEIRGFWIQPRGVTLGMPYATPLTLQRQGGPWRGEVTPLQDRFTLYLPVSRAEDGTLATYLRNPEQNIGIFTQVKSLTVEGGKASLLGNRRGRSEQQALYTGTYESGRLGIDFPNRGGEYAFHKITGDSEDAFHPRHGSAPYRYAQPPHRDDGWPTATPEEVGLSRGALEAFVQKLIDTPMSSVNASQVHAVLIARHGKLVLEEYFHGYDRDRPHDTRSAAKSFLSVLVGAAMHSGIKVGPETPVYATMLGGLPADLDPRKRAMRLEHLLTMTGGHFCDDNNPEAPGNEDAMQEQEREPDWYRYILALPMDRTPGEKIVYCSADAHLAGGVLSKAAGEPLLELFDRLVARPLGMGRYHIDLAPTGEAYTGGGWYLLPRDFLKGAQLLMDDGSWKGRRIVSRDWARKSTSALYDLSPRQQYGYLWNSAQYPHHGRKVRAFFAGGNGGQISLAIPELDLAIAFTGGNYADASSLIPQRELVPEQILPAIDR